MAVIKVRNTGEVIEGKENVAAFLNNQGVLYERWDASKLPAHLQNKFVLTDEEKAHILATFQTEIEDLAKRRGYKTWDVVALCEQTPNLEELLKNLNKCIHIRKMKCGRSSLVMAFSSLRAMNKQVILTLN